VTFELKEYQKKTLSALKAFLDATRIDGPEAAFAASVSTDGGSRRVASYRKVTGMEEVPYVCLRLPTGGGKTILASHSIAIAANAYLERDFPTVLWLVPTNTIRNQTLEALKKPGHAYRRAIDDAFEGMVSVFDISEVEQVRPQDLTGRVCVVVGTLATLRVTNTEGRRIYAHNENFEPHFARVPSTVPGLERIEEGPDRGKAKFSFANLLSFHRPLVIMDEAHNARTPLTFETLHRIRPACIIEFTATPDTRPRSGSNILYGVSAAELKAEEMIKLPIMLTEHQTWQAAVRDALLTVTRLKEVAKDEPDFLRPIALFQAESRDRDVTVEVLRNQLIEEEKIAPERIAVATGDQRELDGIDLFDPSCGIDCIITVEALKEGWDCSFAYVFCSAANIRSAKDVEQILGRVLRMPYAKSRNHRDLNRAYAHVSSPSFAQAAQELRDRLVSMGFEETEAKEFVQPAQPVLPGTTGISTYPFEAPLRLIVRERPDLVSLPAAYTEAVRVEEESSGFCRLVVSGDIPEDLEHWLVETAPQEEREETRRVIHVHRDTRKRRPSPAERGDSFAVPRLCVVVQGELEIADRDLCLDASGWNLLDYPAELTEADFSIRESAHTFEVDVKGNRVVYGLADSSRQLDLDRVPTSWTDLHLVRWLDKRVRQQDIRQEVMIEFLRRTIRHLLDHRKVSLTSLVRCQFILAKAVEGKIREYRQQAYDRGYQECLFDRQAQVETSFEYAFRFPPDSYPANRFYDGAYRFERHYYRLVGELENSGEEFECARAIDRMPQVKHWVRNIPRYPHSSFWLPTSTDLFYPDFVAELADGRILVVEYKGEPYAETKDTMEKRNIGELWEEKSGGKGLFLIAVKRDGEGRDVYNQLIEKIRGTRIRAG